MNLIAIKLTMEEWNLVLDCMSDSPVRKAMPLINKIVAQAREQGLGATPAETDGAKD